MSGDDKNNEKNNADDSSKDTRDLGESARGRQWRIRQWFQGFSEDLLVKLRTYNTELLRYNGRINLISPRSEGVADQIHFADCLLGSEVVLNATDSDIIYDFGSGNGFPGLIVALLAPERQVKLIDSDARKIEFLKHIIARLELKNCEPCQQRVESLAENEVQTAISRGLANITNSILSARKPIKPGGEFFHFKTDSWVKEVAALPPQTLNYWQPEMVGDYKLPGDGASRYIVLTRKIG